MLQAGPAVQPPGIPGGDGGCGCLPPCRKALHGRLSEERTLALCCEKRYLVKVSIPFPVKGKAHGAYCLACCRQNNNFFGRHHEIFPPAGPYRRGSSELRRGSRGRSCLQQEGQQLRLRRGLFRLHDDEERQNEAGQDRSGQDRPEARQRRHPRPGLQGRPAHHRSERHHHRAGSLEPRRHG